MQDVSTRVTNCESLLSVCASGMPCGRLHSSKHSPCRRMAGGGGWLQCCCTQAGCVCLPVCMIHVVVAVLVPHNSVACQTVRSMHVCVCVLPGMCAAAVVGALLPLSSTALLPSAPVAIGFAAESACVCAVCACWPCMCASGAAARAAGRLQGLC